MSKNYETIRLGSTGDTVRELQNLLKNQGYNIVVDGNFGTQTQAAVREYQKKYGLTVDGVVGSQTWGQLYSPAKTASTTSYTPSEEVISAGKAVEALESGRPGEYESQYGDALSQLYDKIMSRPAFSYDLGADPLYQQYRDSYTSQGRLAMEDTMGRAAGLTGGYGSTYSQTAGQQSYHGYLQGLNDSIPQLYELALSRYAQEGQGLMDQFELLRGLEADAYGQYEDAYDRWYRAYALAQDRYDDARQEDYDRYMDMLDYWKSTEKTSTKRSSSGSSASSKTEEAEGSALSRDEVKMLAKSYMASGHSGAIGSGDMIAWMESRGIPKSSYEAFYEMLSVLGYKPKPKGGGGGGTQKTTVALFD